MSSDLEMSYSTLLARVGDFLGLGRTSSAWSTDDQARVDSYLASGYRQFLYPAILGRQYVHEWSFLHPMDSITTEPDTALTGTLTFTEDSTAVTGSGTAFDTELIAGDRIQLDADGTWYTVSSVTDATNLVLGSAYDDTTASGASTIEGRYLYEMDADFAGIEGPVTYSPGDGYFTLLHVPEGQIRNLRQPNTTVAQGRPTHFAIRWKEATGAATQEAEMLLWPTPNDAYTLNFGKRLTPNALSATYTTPLGGPVHSETVLELCLRAAELGMDDARGIHHETAMELLAASIAHDRRLSSAKTLGYNADRSDGGDWSRFTRVNGPVTVGGETPT
jgi:hypothetical protein